jgi:hypothetical protein
MTGTGWIIIERDGMGEGSCLTVEVFSTTVCSVAGHRLWLRGHDVPLHENDNRQAAVIVSRRHSGHRKSDRRPAELLRRDRAYDAPRLSALCCGGEHLQGWNMGNRGKPAA